MKSDLSRRAVVAGAATGISGILGGCSGGIPGSGGGTTTSEDRSVQLNEIEVWNRTDTAHTMELTVLRDEEIVHDETMELKPKKTDDEDTIVQGHRVLHGSYMDPAAEYRIEVDVGDIHQKRDIYYGGYESTCYEAVVEISRRTEPDDIEHLVSIWPYAGELFCEGTTTSQT